MKQVITTVIHGGEFEMVDGIFMTDEYRREVIQTLGDSALYLLQYYHELLGCEYSVKYTNREVAEAIGWTPEKVEKYTQKLAEAGYINP